MPKVLDPQYRSFLFVPGNMPERFDKALASGADVVIIDLEDAVPPDQKEEARRAIAKWVNNERRALVRLNARGTPWFEEDARLCKLPGVMGVVLPKAERATDVAHLVSLIKAPIAVYPLIESARGMWNSVQIAEAPCVQQLIFGTLDFMVDLDLELGNQQLNLYRSELVMVSRIAGISRPIDGVTTNFEDADEVARDTVNGRRWGFGGKLCIHPRQVATVNACYAPTEFEIAWARRVLEASRESRGAAISIDGKMVDRPVMMRAQRIAAMVAEPGATVLR